MAEPFIGEIRLFAFDRIPKGWMPCNGQLLEIAKNQALFSLLGTTYGGDGQKTFALPNLQGRVPLCPGPDDKPGIAGGEALHVLTVDEMPTHDHIAWGGSDATSNTVPGRTWGAPNSSTGVLPYKEDFNTSMNPAALSTAGGSQGHNNMQPYLVLQFCIAVQGYYPPKN